MRTGSRSIQELWRLGHGVESADRDTLVLTLTVADEPEWIVEFAGLLAGLIEAHRGQSRPSSPLSVWQVEPDVVLTPREAFLRGRRRVKVADAIGEVSAEQFCPYPPGVRCWRRGNA